MNKQLEEPIAVERIHVITPEIFGDVVRADDYDALLQRYERLDAMLTESVEALKASEQTLEREREKSRRVMSENQQLAQRVAELEEKYSEVSGWYVKMKTRMLSAEKRLDTPVQLPQCHSMLLREDFQSDYRSQMAFKAGEVMAAISKAGFKVEGA